MNLIENKQEWKKCILCGNTKKLCKAHIINKSAIKKLYRSPKDTKVLLLNRNGAYKQHELVSDNLYDKNILCGECDNSYSIEENYFMSFIQQRVNGINLIHLSTIIKSSYSLVQYQNFDHQKFKIALLFILWKSSVSNQPAFKSFFLGEDENKIKNIIISNPRSVSSAYPLLYIALKK